MVSMHFRNVTHEQVSHCYCTVICRGYRYTLRDQDTTWLAAYESLRRGHDKEGFIYRITKYGL